MFARPRGLIAVVGLLGCAPPPGVAPALGRSPSAIDTLAIRAHTYFLASDLLAGRATGTPGADIAARYIAAQCQRLGLASAGSDYLEPVPLERITMLPESTVVTLTGPGDSSRFAYRSEFVVATRSKRALRDYQGLAVFVGAADDIVAATELPPQLRGGIAITLGTLPPGPAVQRLEAAGAAGMLHLSSEPESFEAYARNREDDALVPGDPGMSLSLSAPLPAVLASPDLSRRLLAGTPILSGQEMGPRALADSVTVRLAFTSQPVPAHNVACRLGGADQAARDTAIVLSAHYDHLGIGTPDERGDSVYNGFSDNAAGVAMVLAVGQALRSAPEPPRHSVLLLFFTAEERGLLGSDHYVAHPSWPLDRILGVVNLDAGAPPAPPWSWRVAGGEGSALGRLVVDVAMSRGWSATVSPATPNSDYFAFARNGVPAIFIIPGPAPYEGLTRDSSQALFHRWDHYHAPADEWHPDFPWSGVARYAEYAYRVVRALDRGLAPEDDRRAPGLR